MLDKLTRHTMRKFQFWTQWADYKSYKIFKSNLIIINDWVKIQLFDLPFITNNESTEILKISASE